MEQELLNDMQDVNASLRSQLAAVTAERDRLREVMSDGHLEIIEAVMFCEGAKLGCELKGDEAGMREFTKLSDRLSVTASKLYTALEADVNHIEYNSFETKLKRRGWAWGNNRYGDQKHYCQNCKDRHADKIQPDL